LFQLNPFAVSVEWSQFVDACEKLLTAINGFVMSVPPSAWNSSVPNGRNYMKFDTWLFFESRCVKIKI